MGLKVVEFLREKKEGSKGEGKERGMEGGSWKELDLGMGESSRFKDSLRTTVYGSFLIEIGTNASLYPGGRILSKSC